MTRRAVTVYRLRALCAHCLQGAERDHTLNITDALGDDGRSRGSQKANPNDSANVNDTPINERRIEARFVQITPHSKAMITPFFDEENAKKSLDKIVQDRCDAFKQDSGTVAQLLSIDLSNYAVVMFREPKSWRLSSRNEITGSMEPVLLRFQGIICECALPPIVKPSPRSMERARIYLRQGVGITGLGTQSFTDMVHKIEQIQLMLENESPPDTVDTWAPKYSAENHPIITCYNRYFTRTSTAPNQPRIPFERSVDPDEYLKRLQDDDFGHLDDNRVEYYGQSLDIPVGPGSFRQGDIVEVSVEFCMFPSSDRRCVPVIQLKAIRMLNTEHRNNASILAMRSRYSHNNTATISLQVTRVPKRRGVYDQEEVDNTNRKLQKMSISDS